MGTNPCWQHVTGVSKPAIRINVLPEGGCSLRRYTRPRGQSHRGVRAIGRMASEDPGPGQQYALQARKHIATLWRARPGIVIEIQWCLANKGIAGNEKADEWPKIAAEMPDTLGVEWLNYSDRAEARAIPLPQSRPNLKREISERSGGGRPVGGGPTSKATYQLPASQKPDSTVAGSTKRLASRLY